MKKPAPKPTTTWGKTWYFLWHEDSLASWLVNIVLAFLLIRFAFYPLLGVVLGTPFPIVAVVSESMEHGLYNNVLCSQPISNFKESFDNYWDICGKWYESHNITKEQFGSFPLNSGFNKGDVILLWRANEKNVQVGDVLVFQASRPQPIIHRVVKIWDENGERYYQTKGDHNSESILNGGVGEGQISSSRVFGKGAVRIPYLGWVKILFVDLVKPFGIVIER